MGENPCTGEIEVSTVRGASVTRMGNSIAAIFENFIGTGVIKFGKKSKKGKISLKNVGRSGKLGSSYAIEGMGRSGWEEYLGKKEERDVKFITKSGSGNVKFS